MNRKILLKEKLKYRRKRYSNILLKVLRYRRKIISRLIILNLGRKIPNKEVESHVYIT